jgi:arginyl-tRNA synthetase
MLHRLIQQRLHEAAAAVFPGASLESVQVRPCPDPRFGDYQCAAVIGLAKERRLNPRQAAADVAARVDVREWCEPVEVAGAGFLNFRLRSSSLAEVLGAALRGEHFFFARPARPRTIVIDFSSPNVAKPMHVGHIRSTILGDSLARVLRLLGHRVITDNHIGDWGTQFGKLLAGWKEHLDPAALAADPIAEMERLYRLVNTACDTDPAVLERARQELVRLQGGDPENLAIWGKMIELSRRQFDAVYARLGVAFDHTLGESFYNPRLHAVVSDLFARNIARESEGAAVVFFEDQPGLEAHPAIIRKSDGAANYTTTDLATLDHRLEEWRPDEIVYVTDGRQQLHFKQLFAIFRRWRPEARVRLAHVWFGAILGEDGRPFRTRAGDTVRLTDLLDEAEERAWRVVEAKNPDLDPAERRQIARAVGLGAVRYADLQPNRQSDYIFNWDRMLALDGNTAPYLQYAHARIKSIFRRLAEQGASGEGWRAGAERGLTLGTGEEAALARHLLNFGFVLEAVADEYRPNYLCNYLYELAGKFTAFYEQCPVLKAAEPERSGRLALCDLTARLLQQGLALLGIATPERM